MRTSPILDDIIDVRVTTPANGQTLVYQNGRWVNSVSSATATTLDGLTDVITTNPAEGDVLTYNGTEWVNTPPPPAGFRQVFIAATGQTIFGPLSMPYVIGAGQLSLYVNGAKLYPGTYTETSTTSFTLGSPSNSGDAILAEISTVIPPYIQPTPATTLDDLLDVSITSPSPNQVITFNGTEWVNNTISTDGMTVDAGSF
jgi:hypothetical protein